MSNPLCPKTERERDEARHERDQQERFKWRANERADAVEAELERYHKALSNLVEAGEHVDSFLSKDGPPFKFNGKSQGVPVETALLSLHDYLNDARAILKGESS